MKTSCDGVVFEVIDLQQHPDGFVVTANNLYLGTTYESIGSNKYAMSLIGCSSIGRLGMFLQISANLGHTGSSHNWTLEIIATMPIRLYYKMIIGQVSFWSNSDDIVSSIHKNKYNSFNIPIEGRGIEI